MRKEMLERIHESHLGEEKCKARARGTLYWLAKNDYRDIRDGIKMFHMSRVQEGKQKRANYCI